jgi:hypothetical protein
LDDYAQYLLLLVSFWERELDTDEISFALIILLCLITQAVREKHNKNDRME